MLRKLFAIRFDLLAMVVASVLGSATPACAGQLLAFHYSLPGNGSTPIPVAASGFFAETDLLATSSPVYFSFSYSMTGIGPTPQDVSASGILTTFQIDADTYLVSDISGTRNGESILSLLSPGGFGGNDNILLTTDPHLTVNGLSYAVDGEGNDGTGDVNVFAVAGGYAELSSNADTTPDFNLSQIPPPVPSEIPEPASVTLVCAGIPIALFLLRRRSMAKHQN